RRSLSPSTAAGWRSRRRATWWGRRRTCSQPGRFARTSPTSSRRWVSSPTSASLAYSRARRAGTRRRWRGSGPAPSPTRLTRRPPGGAQDGGVPPRRSAPPPPAPPVPVRRAAFVNAELASGGPGGRGELLQDETAQRLSVEGDGGDGGRGRFR